MKQLILGLFIGLNACHAAVTPHPIDGQPKSVDGTLHSARELPDITAGLTHFRFSDWAGPEVPVWTYVPHGAPAQTAPIMILMHGAKRSSARYLSEWDQFAEAQGFIIIAPEFSKALFPGSARYNLGNQFDPDTDKAIDESLWSFTAIEPIFEQVVSALQGKQTTYTLYGHSAGSQFTHRFMYFKPDAKVSRFLPANAGWYTMPDLDVPYPYGLGGTSVTETDLAAALSKDVVVLLGDKDDNPDHSSLNRSDGAMIQGDHRYARGLKFYETGKRQAARFGVEFGWKIRVIPGVAHSNGGIAAGASDLIR